MGTHKLYRVKNGQFLGLCEGIARWRDLPVSMVRLGVVIAAFMTGIFPVLVAYVVLSLIIETEPSQESSADYRSFSKDYHSRKEDVSRNIRREYENIRRRVNRMEHDVVNREQDWDERFRKETT